MFIYNRPVVYSIGISEVMVRAIQRIYEWHSHLFHIASHARYSSFNNISDKG